MSILANPAIKSEKTQKLGMFMGFACAVHCSVMPLFLAALPAMGSGFLNSPFFEAVVILSSLAIGYYFLIRGYLKHDPGLWPLGLLSIGAFLILFPHLWPVHIHWMEYFLAPLGGLTIAGAQYLNYKASKKVAPVCGHDYH